MKPTIALDGSAADGGDVAALWTGVAWLPPTVSLPSSPRIPPIHPPASPTAGPWRPPRSPFGLLEELLWDRPWALLLCCILLNQTSRVQVDPVLCRLLRRAPDAAALASVEAAELEALLRPLGLHRRRAQTLLRFSRAFLAGSWRDGVAHSDYFLSPNCVREFREAVRLQKAMVVVLETDAQHGGVSFETHEAACPEEVGMRQALANSPRVPWYRLRHLQDVSLKAIACELREWSDECEKFHNYLISNSGWNSLSI